MRPRRASVRIVLRESFVILVPAFRSCRVRERAAKATPVLCAAFPLLLVTALSAAKARSVFRAHAMRIPAPTLLATPARFASTATASTPAKAAIAPTPRSASLATAKRAFQTAQAKRVASPMAVGELAMVIVPTAKPAVRACVFALLSAQAPSAETQTAAVVCAPELVLVRKSSVSVAFVSAYPIAPALPAVLPMAAAALAMALVPTPIKPALATPRASA